MVCGSKLEAFKMWEGPSGSTLTTGAFGSLATLHWKQSVRLQYKALMHEGSCAVHENSTAAGCAHSMLTDPCCTILESMRYTS